MQVYRFVSSALCQKFLRLPEWKFCLCKIYSEPRRIFAFCRVFMVCKIVRVKIMAIRRGGACSSRKFAQTNLLLPPPRDPNGFAVCATRFDSATRRCCFAQDDRGRNFCQKPIDARAYSAFADHEKSVKRSHASRFRRMFTRYEVNITAGRGALFPALPCTDKAR